MKQVISWGAMALLLLVGLMALPAAAGELRVTGFIDSAITAEQNVSNNPGDFDVTRNKDTTTVASTRSQLFFNFIASDNLRGIMALELDQTWGQCATCRGGGNSSRQSENAFDWGTDNNVFELKQLYVDFRLPQLPFGNRWRVGGPRFNATPLHPNLLLAIDAGGADVNFTFSPQVSLLLQYIQIEENSENFPGSLKVGEDYLTGFTLMLKPLPRWDLHFPFVYQHLQAPFGTIAGGLGTPFSGTATPLEVTNVTTEDRYWLGFDSRYRLGNLSIEPSFFYLTGTRRFCPNSGGVPVPGHGTSRGISGAVGGTTTGLTPCTSAATGGVRELDINAFGGMLDLNYALGRWLLSGRFVYTSGDEATTDKNNQGLSNGRTRGDINHFRLAGAEAARWNQWLSILGGSTFGDGRHDVAPWRLGEASNIGLDRFGTVLVASKIENKLRDNLLVRGFVGARWAAETPACPAVQRTAAVTATNPTGCADLRRNWTGDSKYLGTEVDLFLDWTIMPGLLFRNGGGYAFLGDGLETNNGKVQDAWYLLSRLLYVF